MVSIQRERSSEVRFAKKFLAVVILNPPGGSGMFEKQDVFVAQMDLFGFPRRTWVVAVRVGIGRIPGAVEPVKVRHFIVNSIVSRIFSVVFHGIAGDLQGDSRNGKVLPIF